MQHTPLTQWHVDHGATMVDFASWQMPVSYAGILQEHLTVRSGVGLFDVSHMGEIFIQGPGAADFLDWMTVSHPAKLLPGQSQYSLLCTPSGGIVEDLIIYRLTRQNFLLCVNAANTAKVVSWLQGHRRGEVEILDKSAQYGLIALQGPRSSQVLGQILGHVPESLPFSFEHVMIDGVAVMASRTGYTGEDGFELFVPWEQTLTVWQSLLQAGADDQLAPIGLGARDTLRLEKGYSLYGHEIDETTHPLEAGLSWVVAFTKADFLGREALLRIKRAGLQRKKIAFVMLAPGIPRQGYPIFVRGAEVGTVTSGSYSPCLKKGIGLGYVPLALADTGAKIEIAIRQHQIGAQVSRLPLINKKHGWR